MPASPSVLPSSASPEPTPTIPLATSQPSESAATDPETPVPLQVTFITLDVVQGTLEATGLVSGTAQDGGECTLVLTRDDVRFEVTAAATAASQNTYCGLMQVAPGELSPGEWSATLQYEAGSNSGVSDSQVVTLP